MTFNNQKHLAKLFEECIDRNGGNKENTQNINNKQLFDINSKELSRDRINVSQITRNNNNNLNNFSYMNTSDDHSNLTLDTSQINNTRDEKNNQISMKHNLS